MFNLDQHVISETKALAKRAERVLQLANETGPAPETAAAILAIGEEIGGVLTQLSRAVQAKAILERTIETLHARAETMQRSQHIDEMPMLQAFAWPVASSQAWGDLASFDDQSDEEGEVLL